jgi:hypothetical protein
VALGAVHAPSDSIVSDTPSATLGETVTTTTYRGPLGAPDAGRHTTGDGDPARGLYHHPVTEVSSGRLGLAAPRRSVDPCR